MLRKRSTDSMVISSYGYIGAFIARSYCCCNAVVGAVVWLKTTQTVQLLLSEIQFALLLVLVGSGSAAA